MAGVTGRTVKMAFAKFATNSWNVAASVTKGVYFKSDAGMNYSPEVIEDKSFGNLFVGPSARGNINAIDLTLEGQSRYDDNTYIFDALAMGSPSVALSTSFTGAVTSWKHIFDLANNTDGLGVTVAIDKNQFVEELTSAKVYGWTEKNDAGVMTSSYKVLGSAITIASSINITSTLAVATYPTLGNWCLKNQGVWRMNAQGGAGLAAGDTNNFVESVDFTWARPQDQSFGFGSANILEPADNEFPSFTLKLGFARMNTVSANSLRVGIAANTAYKADWTFSGSLINSTDSYQKKYEFPYLELTEFSDDVESAGQVKPSATFVARLPAAAPTGMTVTKPFRLTRIMVNSVVAF